MLDDVLKKLYDSLFHESEYELTEDEKEKQKYFIENILNSKEFGDIIWAEKYEMDEEDTTVSPFIVIGKIDDKLLACKVSRRGDFKNVIPVKINSSDMVSYIVYRNIKTIDYLSYREATAICYKRISDDKIKKLKNGLIPVSKRLFYKDLGLDKETCLDLKQDFDIGDVILSPNGKHSLIIDLKEDGNYVCINIDSFNEETESINFNEENFNFFDRFVLYRRNYKYFGTIPNKQLLAVLNKYNEYLNNVDQYYELKETSTLVRGAIIRRNYNYYYVSTIEAKKAKLFLLELSDQNDPEALSFGGLYFKPHYNETDEIDEMDTESRIIRTATEDEMDIVKKDRKSKSKMNKPVTKKEPKSKNKVEFNDGDIIQSEAFFNTKFLIIGFYDNIIITVELDYFMKGKLLIREFYDNDKRLHLIKYNTHEEEAVFNNNQGYFLALFDEICDQKDNEDSKGPRLTMKIDA